MTFFYSDDVPENHLMSDRVRRTHSFDLSKTTSQREVRTSMVSLHP